MQITLNGQVIETQQTMLDALLIEQGYDLSSAIATALDGEFIAKEQRQQTTLHTACAVDVVAPMQGG